MISEKPIIPAIEENSIDNQPVQAAGEIQTTGVTFQIYNAKIYVPVVTLLINDEIKFLKNIKQWLRRIISWNKYISEIATQPKNNNLDYQIDPAFRNVNRLFLLSLQNGNDNPIWHSFGEYSIP